MPDKKKLSYKQFADALLKGEFPDLLEPNADVSTVDNPPQTPSISFKGAEKIGAPSGPMTPQDLPGDQSVSSVLRKIMGTAKRGPQGEYITDDPTAVMGMLGMGDTDFGNLIKMGKEGLEFKANALKLMEKAIKAGQDLGKQWHPLSQYLPAFGDDASAARMFARFWGSTSPNTPVARTNYEAIQAWRKMLAGEIPFTIPQARQADLTMVPAKVPNLNRALQGEPIQSGPNYIGKTEAMARLVAGDPYTKTQPNIPVDVHAIAGIGAKEDNVKPILTQVRAALGAKRGSLTPTDVYNEVAAIYQRGLDKFGADFPTMWEGIKRLKGQGPSAGLTSWLDKWGLLQPGHMVDPEALAYVAQNIDRAEFYGQQLKNSTVAIPEKYHPEIKIQNLAAKHAQEIRDLTAKNQGATFNLYKGNLSGTEHYAVSAYPDRTVTLDGAPSTSKIQDFIKANADLLNDSENSVGTWWDKTAHKFVLDVTKTVPNKDVAIKLGRKYGQKAIYDLGKGEEIWLSLKPKEVAELYAQDKGFPSPTPHPPVKVDEEFARKVADVYDKLEHNPDDPKTKAAYAKLKSEISDQFEYITQKGGLQVEPWTKPGQPYANSQEMFQDVNENNHMFYFPTEAGFGTEAVSGKAHPLLEPGKSGLPANDELRIVHDYLAHALGGHQFGPSGEENAFLEHAKLLSPEARKALATETRGQNSWVNFGKHLRTGEGETIPKKGEPGFIPPQNRPFAPQKSALMPDEFTDLIGKVKEMLDLEHRSPLTDLTELDPEKYGSAFAGEEKARLSDPDFLKRSYLSVAGTPIEARLRGLPGLYKTRVPKETIYPISTDPLGLIEKAQRLGGTNQDRIRTLFERMVKEAGFKGYTDGRSVAYFEKVPVTR